MGVKADTGLRARWSPIARLGESVLYSLFHYETDRLSSMVRWLVAAGLLSFGLLLWGLFYNWGDISLDFLDWAEVTGPRYALLKDAAMRGVIPLHAANTTALRGATDRYFSIADTPFSPQYLLLRYLDISRFLAVDLLLFYVIGFIGLFLIQRKYRLSPFVFTLLFLLFNFNGSIIDHLAVGHSVWVAYFLLPYFILLVFELVERGRAGWMWVLGLAVWVVVVLMQGGFHLYLWSLMFLAILGLFNLRLIKPVVLGGLFSVLVALPRLLPPSLALAQLKNEYLGGFASLTDLLVGLLVLRDPDHAVFVRSKIYPLGWWELDFFIGLIGFGLILFFGIVLPLVRDRSRQSLQVTILLPVLTITALSIGRVYEILTRVLPVPPFTGERVTSRFFLLALTFFLVLAMIFLQRELDRRKFQAWVLVTFLAGAVMMFHDLMRHMESWWIRFIDGLTNLFPKVPFDPAQHTLAIRADPVYIGMLAGGALVTVLSLVFLAAMTLRERRQGKISG